MDTISPTEEVPAPAMLGLSPLGELNKTGWNAVGLKVQIIQFTGAMLTTISCIMVIASLIIFKKLDKMSFRIILYLLVTDLILGLSYLPMISYVGNPTGNGPACQYQAFTICLTNVSVSLWNMALAFYISFTICFTREPPVGFEVCSCILIWGIGLLLPCIGFGLGGDKFFGPINGGTNCFISDAFYQYRIWFVHIFVFLAIFFLFILYFSMAIYVYQLTTVRALNEARCNIRRRICCLVMYPIIYFTIWVWIAIMRFIQLSPSTYIPENFVIFASSIVPWIGFVDCIWYTLSRNLCKRERSTSPSPSSPSSSAEHLSASCFSDSCECLRGID